MRSSLCERGVRVGLAVGTAGWSESNASAMLFALPRRPGSCCRDAEPQAPNVEVGAVGKVRGDAEVVSK